MNAEYEKLKLVNKDAFSAKDALMAGLTYYELNKLVHAGTLIKEGRGVFIKKNSNSYSDYSEHYAIALAQLGEPSALCLWSALVLHDLTEEAPPDIWVYVPYEKTTRLNIRIIRKRNPYWHIGIEVFEGVRCTNIERTLVDAMADRKHFTEVQAYKMTMDAIRMKKTTFRKLYEMAKRLNVEKRLRRDLLILEEIYVQR
jgi:predicted transcriptional regulator of viral defense system